MRPIGMESPVTIRSLRCRKDVTPFQEKNLSDFDEFIILAKFTSKHIFVIERNIRLTS